MQFSISKDILLKGLSKTQSIVERKTTLPILSNVLLDVKKETVNIIATDLEVVIKGHYESDVEKEGSVTVSAKKLFEIVREMPQGDIKIKTYENNWLEITCQNVKFKIVGLSADDFPILPNFSDDDFHPIPSMIFADMIEKVQHSISSDETRYYLNGVFFQTMEIDGKKALRLVATDGHRLAMMENELPDNCKIEMDQGCIIPRKGINEIKKALTEFDGDAEIGFKDKNMILRGENLLFVIRLIDDDFPDYTQVIPTNNEKNLSCSRDQLLGSLRRVSILSTDITRGVKFTITNKTLELSVSNPDIGEAKENMVVDYENEDMTIGFNAKYFIEILNIIKDEELVINLADELSPGLIKVPSDKGFTAVIMPMRL